MKRRYEKLWDPVVESPDEQEGWVKEMRGGKDQDLDEVNALTRFTARPEHGWSDCGLRLVRNVRVRRC